MTQSQIDKDLPYIELRCQRACKSWSTRGGLSKGRIRDKYDPMRHGDSVVGDALAHVREMSEEFIDLTPTDIQRIFIARQKRSYKTIIFDTRQRLLASAAAGLMRTSRHPRLSSALHNQVAFDPESGASLSFLVHTSRLLSCVAFEYCALDLRQLVLCKHQFSLLPLAVWLYLPEFLAWWTCHHERHKRLCPA
jgi:hypothetical protein